ncbi:uncharacterized protein [Pagrus major]|uniref:uncharacterized protein n=1 Tax=Pagrus major TaxID=143350 RepID=UPI003CC84AFF
MRMKLPVAVLLSCLSLSLTDQSDPKQDEGNPKIICPKSQEATVGEDVTLDCYFQPQQDVTKENFEWKTEKKELALVYKSRDFSAADQAEKFKNRASLGSDGNLTEGKIPLKITNVTKADEGTYSCFFVEGRRSCKIQLIIVQPNKPGDKVVQSPNPTLKPTDPPKNNISAGAIAGLAVGIPIVLALIAAIVTVIYRYCQTTNTTPESNDPAPEKQPLNSEGELVPDGKHAPSSPERPGTQERRRGHRTTDENTPETFRLKSMGNPSDSGT